MDKPLLPVPPSVVNDVDVEDVETSMGLLIIDDARLVDGAQRNVVVDEDDGIAVGTLPLTLLLLLLLLCIDAAN